MIKKTNLKNKQPNKLIILLGLFSLFYFIPSYSQNQPYGNPIGSTENTKVSAVNEIGLAPTNPIICTSVNGISVTTSGSEQGEYANPNATNTCIPSSAHHGFGYWTGIEIDGFVTYTFGQPLTSATISYATKRSNYNRW